MAKKQEAIKSWNSILKKYSLNKCPMFPKLSRVQFVKTGEFMFDKNYRWVKLHFPSIIKDFNKLNE